MPFIWIMIFIYMPIYEDLCKYNLLYIRQINWVLLELLLLLEYELLFNIKYKIKTNLIKDNMKEI